MSKISVIIKRPGEKAHRTNISSTLENLQKTAYEKLKRYFERTEK